ncbi:FkbM family methyltransferase [Streptomyces sp. NPDC001709]
MQLPNGLRVEHVNIGETALLYREIFTERCYLRHGISLTPGGVVFDIGANIGLSTLFFHTECPGLTFHAFEPCPEPYAALAANLSSHGIAGTATRCALSDYSGTGRMTYYPDSTGMSGFHADEVAETAVTREFLLRGGVSQEDVEEMLAARRRPVTVECPVRTLSEVIAERGVTTIDLLKLDVEKSELAVLRGIDAADWPRIRQVAAEVHDVDDGLRTVTSLLEEHGFTVATSQAPLLEGSGIHEVFAVRRDG